MKKNQPRSYIPLSGRGNARSIDDYLNEYFEQVDAKRIAEENFFLQYYSYLQNEREKIIDDINEALFEVANEEVELELCRIVDLEYANNPLSAVGSLQESGQRFNIGLDLQKFREFPCLYLASDDETAFAEKFHYQRGYKRGDLTAENYAARKPGNYANFVVKAKLTKCIDIREKDSLRKFCDVISQIKPSKELLSWAKELGYLNLKTVQTPGELLRTILDPEFLKVCMALDIPSNSQWFGFYCLRSGIQAVIYPSVRNLRGTNYAVLIDNLKDSDSAITLTSKTSIVHDAYKKMDCTNYEFFKIKTASKLLN